MGRSAVAGAVPGELGSRPGTSQLPVSRWGWGNPLVEAPLNFGVSRGRTGQAPPPKPWNHVTRAGGRAGAQCWATEQHNILVFSLDTEQPLNGKEARVPPSAATLPAVPVPHRAAFVWGPECKIGVSGCRVHISNFLAFISCATQTTIFNPKCFLPFPSPSCFINEGASPLFCLVDFASISSVTVKIYL